jgi:hypothetical protein
VQEKHEFVQYEVPTLQVKKRLKLKEPMDARFVSIASSLDQRTFLVSSSTNAGLRKRSLHASTDGKELPMPKAVAGETSGFLRLRRTGSLLELEDFLHGNTQVVGQQQYPMQTWAIHPQGKLAAIDEVANDRSVKITLWDLVERRPILTLPIAGARKANATRISADGRTLICTTAAGWTRVLPMDWLQERKELLPCNNEVGPP